MRKAVFLGLVMLLATFALVPYSNQATAASDQTTKYRVYQMDKPIREFADYKQALRAAQGYTNSRVEEIGSGKWMWDNFPRYQVFQLGTAVPNGGFTKQSDAVSLAAKLANASVRDLQGKGWVWNNYPRFRMYQGAITLPNWNYATLKEAQAAAKYWGSVHVIDLQDNRWVWDNYTANRKKELRSGNVLYQVYQNEYTRETWQYGYLEDAVKEALKWGNSHIRRISDNKVVYTNYKGYKVVSSDNQLLKEFVSLDKAIQAATALPNTVITFEDKEIWSNKPTYTVYQKDQQIGGFYSIPEALAYAKKYTNTIVLNVEGKSIWNNLNKLQVWAWNGASAKDTILQQTSAAMGLDVDSPSWFQLNDADGGLKDTSTKETVELLKAQGIQVHPMVTNQFDSALTTKFLANPAAQDKFITALIARAAELQVEGINIDFESLNGKDRNAFTEFVSRFTTAAHSKGIKVSIDLPRGSVKWNHLSAFDHEKLGGIVDYIITMAYDQHYSGSTEPGSVAGLPWVEEGIKEFLSYGIPRDKLILGIPFYTREWVLDSQGAITGTRAIYTRDLKAFMTANSAVSVWDPNFQQNKVEYTAADGTKRVFWLEDASTVQARMELAKKYELAGIAAWRLGQENLDFWPVILQYK